MNKLTTSQFRYVSYTFLLLLLAISLIILCKIFLIENYFDFTYYYLAIQAFIKGNNPYLIHVFPFPYPPLAILTLLPFMIFPIAIAAKSYVVLLFILLILSLYILFRLFKIPYFSLQSIVIIILICNYFPVKYSLSGGQINTVVLFFVVLFIYWFVKKRDLLAGGSITIAIMLKLFPPFIIPYLFFIKRYSLIKSFIISSIILSFFVLIFIPLPIIASYFNTILPTFLHTGGGTYYFDQSLSAFIARSFSVSVADQISKPLALVVLLMTYMSLWKFRNNQKTELLSLSVLLILDIILGNFAWQHHFIWMLVPYIITFIFIRDNQLPRKLYAILGLSYLLTAANIPNPRLVAPILQSHVFYGAVILYGLLIYLIIKQPKPVSLVKIKTLSKNKSVTKHKTK